MKSKWLLLASKMLDDASDVFSNHGCNDFDFPSDWTKQEQREFVQLMYAMNGDPENFDPKYISVPDWWVMSFLAEQLANEAKL